MCHCSQGAEPFHFWGDLVEQAGFKLSDIPNTWDARWNFFKPMQQVLRSKGRRKIYALGPQMTTVGPNDGNGLFQHFMIAYGGADIVTPDGKLHTDNPQVREAVIRTVSFLTNSYKQGYVPPEAISWNDADDNNAFHEKLIVMDLDGSISTELAMIKDKKAYYEEMKTIGLPLGEDGKQMPAPVGCRRPVYPQGHQEPRSRQGLRPVLHAARGAEYKPQGRAGPHGALDAAHREGGPLVARPERPPPGALYGRIGAGTHHRARTTATIPLGAR